MARSRVSAVEARSDIVLAGEIDPKNDRRTDPFRGEEIPRRKKNTRKIKIKT